LKQVKVSMARDTIKQKNAEIRKQKDLTAMRRTDREVTDEEWIKRILREGAFGTLATSLDDQPFLNVNNYVYDEEAHALYIHRSRIGRTSANLEVNPRVCYSVAEMGRIKTADKAMDFGVAYQSVIVFGTASLVTDAKEAGRALKLLLEKYAPHLTFGEDYQPFDSDDLKRTAVYKISIEQWSGKKRGLDEDAGES
jgi:nitroimidazol reductase NimA-like FMN-containing flavoprotein (pyridoxamine 5'-phosphate oxidase superfamily)